MKIFIDPLFLYLFVFALLYLKIPNVETDNYITHKILLFLGILIFDFALQLIKRIRSSCIVKTDEVFSESIKTALYGIIGYSLYIDTTIMTSTKDYLMNYNCSYNQKIAIITVFIITIISLAKLMDVIIFPKDKLSLNCY